MGNIAISVIVPVYNVEKYIHECLDSILRQTLTSLEIICIDDGSEDACPRILEDYARQDRRIQVIHKPNSGYGHTMNTGILAAKGDYIAIVESDDYIESGMMESLYSVAHKFNVDFVKSNFEWFWGDGEKRVFEKAKVFYDMSLYGKILHKEEIKKLYRGCVANCTGIYNRKFILDNNIFHNETPGASYQDLGFFFQIMMKAQSGYLLDRSFYRYRQDNPASSIASKAKVFCICDEFGFIYRKMKDNTAAFAQYLSVFQLIKLQNARFNFRRIDAKFRLPFLRRIKEEYERSDTEGELDLSFFKDWEKEELKQITEDPKKYIETSLKQAHELIEKTNGYRQLIIYGAGQKGNEVYDVLCRYLDKYEKTFYAVTDKLKEKNCKKGIEVRCIYDLIDMRESAVVVLAVTKRYQSEMMKTLKEIGFKTIVTFE